MRSVILFAAVSLSSVLAHGTPASAPVSAPVSAPASSTLQRTEQKLDVLCCKIEDLEGLLRAFKQFQQEQKSHNTREP